MKIYIPSHQRYDNTTQHVTVNNLSPYWQRRTVLVVNDRRQSKHYRAVMPPGVEIVISNVRGIRNNRIFIGHLAASLNEQTFAMFDDDLMFYERYDSWHMRNMFTKSFNKMMGQMRALLHTHAAVGISTREGNNREPGDLRINTRLLRAFAFQTELFNQYVDSKGPPVMEDFDLLLHLLRAGYSNACIYWCAQGQAATQAAGGCSTFRTPDMQKRAAYTLAKRHPGLVLITHKQRRTGSSLANRVDVQIQWKKAYEQGRRANK